jgi:hypothetical protein
MSTSLLLFTKEERLVVGPLSARVGDEVWSLAGSSVLVVLRRMGPGMHEFVGQVCSWCNRW